MKLPNHWHSCPKRRPEQDSGIRTQWLTGWAVGLLLAASAAGAVELVSVNFAGDSSSPSSQPTQVSDDGRFVLFDSSAQDLVPTDTNGNHPFLRGDVFILAC